MSANWPRPLAVGAVAADDAVDLAVEPQVSEHRDRAVSGALGRFRARVDAWSVVKSSLPPLLALSALAITQPLLDLFGRNPEFFVASDMTKPEIVMFAVAVTLLVPLIGLALVLVAAAIGGARGARWTTDALVAVLAFTLGLTVARQLGLDRTLFAAGVGLVAAVAVTVLRSKYAGFRQLLRYLAFAPLAFLALFVFASESSALLLEGEAAAATGCHRREPSAGRVHRARTRCRSPR